MLTTLFKYTVRSRSRDICSNTARTTWLTSVLFSWRTVTLLLVSKAVNKRATRIAKIPMAVRSSTRVNAAADPVHPGNRASIFPTARLFSGRANIAGHLRHIEVGFRAGPPDLDGDPAYQIGCWGCIGGGDRGITFVRHHNLGKIQRVRRLHVVRKDTGRVIRQCSCPVPKVRIIRRTQGRLLILRDELLRNGRHLGVVQCASSGAQTERKQGEDGHQADGNHTNRQGYFDEGESGAAGDW